MTSRATNVSEKPAKRAVVGRSAATGRFVLKPASKGSSISVDTVRAAVKRLRENEKK